MTTTTEASKLWCPMIRVGVLPSHGGPAGVSDPDTQFHGNCIAGRCAMWRWADAEPEKRTMRQEWACWDEDAKEEPAERPEKVPADAEWVPPKGSGDDLELGYWVERQASVNAEYAAACAARRGFCGLAGRAEVMP